MSTFWRAAKLSYLEYVNHSSSAVRAALKEPLRSKAAARGKVHLRERWYEGGVPGESKYFFVSLNDALHYMLQKGHARWPINVGLCSHLNVFAVLFPKCLCSETFFFSLSYLANRNSSIHHCEHHQASSSKGCGVA
jgi:hypothetical protein